MGAYYLACLLFKTYFKVGLAFALVRGDVLIR